MLHTENARLLSVFYSTLPFFFTLWMYASPVVSGGQGGHGNAYYWALCRNTPCVPAVGVVWKAKGSLHKHDQCVRTSAFVCNFLLFAHKLSLPRALWPEFYTTVYSFMVLHRHAAGAPTD